MNDNRELLEFIHKNSEMGVTSLTQLLKMLEDCEFKRFLSKQYSDYKHIFDESEVMIKASGEGIKPVGAAKKFESYMMINMKTLTDKSPDNISEMLMVGNLMGIIQIIRRLKQFKEKANEKTYNLGQELLLLEQSNLEQSKQFLG